MAKKGSGEPRVREVIPMPMEDVMHASMMPYAEYVILERALPRVEDGLKPVQRRILYTMHELGLTPDKPHKKSARVVGDALGKYHPHGDTSVYDAMVRMAQPFNMSMTLVDGHGNFGSVDGDPAAAMRYTEVRLKPLALELLRDIEKDSVNFQLNFDDSLKEPEILPGRFPNLLVNGASGIAVGLATNIPPHNLGEAIAAVIAQLEEPDISLKRLMRYIKGPDFPTGGFLLGSEELEQAYETGRGKITIRAKTHFETLKNGKKLIVVTELPYQVNKMSALEKILAVTQEKKLLFSGVTDIRDESDRQGMRAIIELRKDADEQKILNYLYKYSDLQQSFSINMVAIAGGKPVQLGLKELIAHYITHQKNVVTRRTKFELEQAERREHILQGMMIAIDNLDAVIALIRASKTPKEAKEGLMKRFALSELQSQAILDLRLQRLTGLEMLAIQKAYEEVVALIKELKGILASADKLRSVIRGELEGIAKEYAAPRRSVFLNAPSEIVVDKSDLTVVEDAFVTVFADGRIIRQSKKGVPRPDDAQAVASIETQSDQKLWLFTDLGAMITLAVDDIPIGKPTLVTSLAHLEEGETVICAMRPTAEGELVFFTAAGMIKRTAAEEYGVRAKKTAAMNLKAGDKLLSAQPVREQSIIMVTRCGMSIHIPMDAPLTGRVTGGVKGIKLDSGDRVIFAAQVPEEGELLCITDAGYMKRSFIFDYEMQGRGGKGLKTFDFKKNGSNGREIAAAFHVCEPFEFIAVQKHGTKTTVNTEHIYLEPRFGKGQPVVMALLDDYVVKAYKTDG